MEEVRTQQRLIRSPNLKDPGYIRQKAQKKLWVRERISALLDQDSFVEVGSTTGKHVYDEKGDLESFVPAYVSLDSLTSGSYLFSLSETQ